jgi:hypothetical protein
MEGQPSAESVSSTPAATSTPSESYSVSSSDLADLGISLDESASEEASGETGFEFSNTANLKTGKDPKQKVTEEEDESETTEAKEDAEDDWLIAAKKDLGIEDDSEPSIEETQSPEKDPLDLKELEIERFGIKQKIPVKDAIKLAQQGYDYTQKTQALAEEKREFERTRESTLSDLNKQKTQLQETLNEKEQLDYFFDYLKSNDPDLYQNLQNQASQFKHQISNPFLEKHMTQLNKQLESLNKKQQEIEEKELRSNFYKEFEELKSMHGAKYAKLGIKLDESKIKEEWIKSGSSLKDIYKQLYADKILSLAQSKGLVDKKAKAASNKAPTMGRMKGGSPKADVSKVIKKMSYSQLADAFMKGQIK